MWLIKFLGIVENKRVFEFELAVDSTGFDRSARCVLVNSADVQDRLVRCNTRTNSRHKTDVYVAIQTLATRIEMSGVRREVIRMLSHSSDFNHIKLVFELVLTVFYRILPIAYIKEVKQNN